ncbi:peptidase inhibitor family I36 protein [Streptomyces sp. NPDC002403]
MSMSMRQRTVRLLGTGFALAAALGFGVVTAPIASADYSVCPANKFCMWQNTNYDGLYAYSSEPQANLHDFNDRASSMWNRTGGYISFYRDSNFEYCLGKIKPGGSSANVGAYVNDRISSFRPGECTPVPGSQFSTF